MTTFDAVKAKFRFSFQTTVTRKQVLNLLDFNFVENRENLVFIGPPGVGKTHLAIAVPVVDRIIHHSHIFVLGGDSYRLKQKSKLP